MKVIIIIGIVIFSLNILADIIIIIDKSYLDKARQTEKKYGNINDLNKALEKIFDYPSMFCEINYSDIYEIK